MLVVPGMGNIRGERCSCHASATCCAVPRTADHSFGTGADDADRSRRQLSVPVLPALLLFGLGLTLVVAPVTATVMAAADERHSGIASGINTAVSRLSGLIIVAVLPLIAGLTGTQFYVPPAMDHGFHVAMLTCALRGGRGTGLADDEL